MLHLTLRLRVLGWACFCCLADTPAPATILPNLQVTLEPYERDHAVVVGVYRPQKKEK